MNTTITQHFQKHLENLKNEYTETILELETYTHDNNIISPLMGDETYYELKITREEIYLDIKRTEAILEGKEFSYIRYHKPVIQHRINRLKDLKNHAEEGV